MIGEQEMITLEIFEDLHRAKMRASVGELEDCLEALEQFKRPRGQNEIMSQQALRQNLLQSIVTLEKRLAALRTRFEALPELSGKKSEEVSE